MVPQLQIMIWTDNSVLQIKVIGIFNTIQNIGICKQQGIFTTSQLYILDITALNPIVCVYNTRDVSLAQVSVNCSLNSTFIFNLEGPVKLSRGMSSKKIALVTTWHHKFFVLVLISSLVRNKGKLKKILSCNNYMAAGKEKTIGLLRRQIFFCPHFTCTEHKILQNNMDMKFIVVFLNPHSCKNFASLNRRSSSLRCNSILIVAMSAAKEINITEHYVPVH